MTLAEKLRKAQLKDVEDMQKIYQAAAQGKTAEEACKDIVGGSFTLSLSTAAGIKKGE